MEQLPIVLWAYRTTPRRSTGETPFFMTYGTEAIIPLEVGLPSLRTSVIDFRGNNQALEEALDAIKEKKEAALIRLPSYQQILIQQRGKNVKSKSFNVGDLVLRKVTLNTTKPTYGKLGPNWEGPYVIISSSGTGAYYLENMDGNAIQNPWNMSNFRKYYH